jgi:hypothetical protein
MTEAELQRRVIDLARQHGVRVFHSGDSRRDTGRGFPDLVLCGLHGVVFAELKDGGGTLSHEQATWKHALLASAQSWVLWRPADLERGHIETALQLIS